MTAGLVCSVLLLSTPCAPASRAWIGEVLYDAAGDDTGREFVELVNAGGTPVALAGARLEAGDGASPGRWTLRWTGGPADAIGPGGRFVIGGALVEPAPDAVVTLDLQNGPDAVRLVWPDGGIEVLGWGSHEFAEYACGAPAVDVLSGQSLARVPDDSNAGSNAIDFRASAPSPRRANRAARDAAIAAGSTAASPARPGPGGPVEVSARVWNAGAETIPPGDLAVAFAWRDAAGETSLGEARLVEPLAHGDSARVARTGVSPAAGRVWLVARVVLAGDEAAANDADSLVMRVGDGPLEIVEVQFHPASGEGEWIEVRATGAPVGPPGFLLSDRGGTSGACAAGPRRLDPGELGVLAQDRAALLAARPGLDSARVWELAPWPSLNNTDGPDGTADALALTEPDGTPSDAMTYAASGVGAGITLERRDGGWWPSLAPGGTPLAPPRLPAPIAGRFDCAPRRVAPGGALRASWDLPLAKPRARIEAWDLAGRLAARPLDETAVPPRGERDVALGGLGPGVYVVTLIARGEDGAVVSASVPVRVAGAAP